MAKKAPLPPPPEPHYSLKRWLADWEWFTDLERADLPATEFDAYFAEKYGEYAAYFRDRLAAALVYKREHIDPIEVQETKELVTGTPLMAAMFRLYSQCPDDKLQEPYVVEMVVALAKQHKPRH